MQRPAEKIEEKHGKHPDKAKVFRIIADMVSKIDAEFSEAETHNKVLIHNDDIAERLTAMLSDRVGCPYPEEDAKNQYEKRKEGNIPPYCSADDTDKNSEDAMGDVVIWLELLKEYKDKSIPLIFVTNDQKENWWEKSKGHHEPQRRLLIEMAECTGSICLFYSAERFIDAASHQLKINGTEELEKETVEIAKLQRERELPKPAQRVRESKRRIREKAEQMDHIIAVLKSEEAKADGPLSNYFLSIIENIGG